MSAAAPPPIDERELIERASALAGTSLAALGGGTLVGGLRQKGKIGEAVERALGATPGGGASHDFPHLGVELKTIPISAEGVPHESTYVCSMRVADAATMAWPSSWVRRKLGCVLWVPIVGARNAPPSQRTIGPPLLWRPTAAQEAILRADFEEVVGLLGVGRVEDVSAHVGRWLQLRPKAASGRDRTLALGVEGEVVATVPRGFYLRPRFTAAILADAGATPT
jgi:DNA mismatch repair protein MutH